MAKFGEWIPITYREMTDEEKQAKADKLGIDPEELTDRFIYTCEMPTDEQQVIITTDKDNVFMTKFYNYGMFEYFEMFEKPGDALAWMPAPEPFSNSEAKMNNDLISREALKKHKVYSEERHEYVVPVYNIDNAPTVELQMGRMTNGVILPIERPQGKWRLTLTGDVICSVCKLPRRDTRTDHIRFCNHCGAKMET